MACSQGKLKHVRQYQNVTFVCGECTSGNYVFS